MNDRKKMLLYLLTAVGVFVVVILVVFIASLFSNKTLGYDALESRLVSATKDYYKKHDLPNEGEEVKITSALLETEGYIKKMSDISKDKTCIGEVKVVKTGENHLYLPKLYCTNYETKTLKSVITKDVVTSGDGLYQDGENYVFRGENVNNYVTFNKSTWRIIRVDETGVKLIKQEADKQPIAWDDRYNAETNSTMGINNYELSRIREKLNDIYTKMNDDTKSHLLPFGVCAGTRAKKNTQISLDIDCSKKIYGDHIGLITPSEYAIASLDNNCNSISSASCYNYNYLAKFLRAVATPNATSDNTYETIYINSYGARYDYSNSYTDYFTVIYLSSDELVSSGAGTIKNPYVLK